MSSGIRTDLALESRELNPDIEGVEEQTEERERMTVSRIKITDRTAAEKLDKPIGKYVTLDAPELCNRPLDLFEQMSAALSEELRDMFTGLKDDATVLVVGLGNRSITSDSLGPRVAERIYVTRHVTEYMPDARNCALGMLGSARRAGCHRYRDHGDSQGRKGIRQAGYDNRHRCPCLPPCRPHKYHHTAD